MRIKAIALLLPLFLSGTFTAAACTIFCGKDDRGHVLAANTEDHRPNMRIYFKARAATDSTYGFFGTTYNHPDGMLQGGSNDQGLFFDTNELGLCHCARPPAPRCTASRWTPAAMCCSTAKGCRT